jgi:hypothetical protein
MDFLNNNTDTQGHANWHADRLGRFTASRYPDLMKNGRGKDAGMGETAKGYVLQVAYEIITGVPQGFDGNHATEWGHENEPLAIAKYEDATGNKVTAVGFCAHPTNNRAGGSPDGLVVTDAFVGDYEWQVQGNLWVTGRKWCDLISYDPRMEGLGKTLHVVRIERDSEKIAMLDARIAEAGALLEEYLEKLGYVEEESNIF